MRLSLLTINAHKGFSALNKRFALPELRECVHNTGADIVFIQEVVGQNLRQAGGYFGRPLKPQYEFSSLPHFHPSSFFFIIPSLIS